jgi:phage portal protein BeeE
MKLKDRLKTAFEVLLQGNLPYTQNRVQNTGAVAERTNELYKAILPEFLYKPPFGYPLNKNVVELRRLARSPSIAMIVNTIIDEIARLDWEIEDELNDEVIVPDEVIEKTKNFFENPNENDESFEALIRKVLRDILELDAGVLIKVRNFKDDFLYLMAYDAGTFNKSPDRHGVLPEFYAYYQYGWLTGARPIPFNRNEVVYFMRNPRTDSIYGLSPVEILQDVARMLIYGIDSNLDYFVNNQVPKGVLKMIGATHQDIINFQNAWSQKMKNQDASGNWKRDFHKMPVMNQEGEFIRVGFSNVELELLEQQKWFSKLCLACFGVTPSEVGLTEDSNKATELAQSSVFKRKAITPIVRLLEYKLNMQVINDLPWIKGKYENKVKFVFNKYDLGEELSKRQILWGDINSRLRTVNECREEINYDEIEGGNEFEKNVFGFQNTSVIESDEDNSEEKYFKKKNEFKAFLTDSPLSLKQFEKKTDKEIDEVIDLNKKEIENELKKKGFVSEKLINDLIAGFSLIAISSVLGAGIKNVFSAGLEKVEKKLNRNLSFNQEALNFLNEYNFDLIKNLNEESTNKLRSELQRAILNKDEVSVVIERVEKVLDLSKNRAKTIAVTELNRAENLGELIAWRESNENVIKTVVNSNPVSDICKHLVGSSVGINEKFSYKGEEWDCPPFHINCKSSLKFKVIK